MTTVSVLPKVSPLEAIFIPHLPTREQVTEITRWDGRLLIGSSGGINPAIFYARGNGRLEHVGNTWVVRDSHGKLSLLSPGAFEELYTVCKTS